MRRGTILINGVRAGQRKEMMKGALRAVFVFLLAFEAATSAAAQPRLQSQRRGARPSPAPYRMVLGQQGHEELLGLMQRFAKNDIAWNIPSGLRLAFDHSNRLKVGDVLGPALDDNRGGSVMFNFEDSPNGRIEKWTELGAGRSFFMYWIINPFGEQGHLPQGSPGTIAYLQTSMPLPLRRHVVVVGQYRGLKTFKNVYGEDMTVPVLQVIAAATTNGYYYIDQDWTTVASDVEFHFDDRAIAALDKKLKPVADGATAGQPASAKPKPEVASLPGLGPKPGSAPSAQSKDCEKLAEILATKDDLAAKHGEEMADKVMAAARKRQAKYNCPK